MMYDLSRLERQHRAIQDDKPGPALQSKRCGYSEATTVKQLAQHGKCAACALATKVAGIIDSSDHGTTLKK